MNTKALLFSLLLAANSASFAVEKNGFDLTGSLIPAEQILAGGPQRDGIPAIDQPNFVNARAADFLENDDRVLGLDYDADNRSGQVLDAAGKPLNAINSYWFAWYAFHPDTEVFKP